MQPSAAPKSNLLVFLSFIILAVLLGTGGYYLGLQRSAKIQPTKTPAPTATPHPGVAKMRELVNINKGLYDGAGFIELAYSGVLKSMDPEKSWTIEKNGNLATITNEKNGGIRYLTGPQGGVARSADASQIEIGDKVRIFTNINLRTGKVTVVRIREITPAQTESPPTPSQ